MKKGIAFLLAVCVMLMSGSALASVEDQLAQVVANRMNEDKLRYEYDAEDQLYTLSFDIDCALKHTDVTIFLYDDMLSVTADSPLQITEDCFEKMAIFLTLVNNEIYYAQFRVDRESGWVTCRSCNVIEGVLPAEKEVDTLLYMPINYMEQYGDGIAAICSEGADPYEAFAACQEQ